MPLDVWLECGLGQWQRGERVMWHVGRMVGVDVEMCSTAS